MLESLAAKATIVVCAILLTFLAVAWIGIWWKVKHE